MPEAELNVREYVMDQLRPLLPKKWKVVPYTRDFDVLDTTVVMLATKTIRRSPAAPQGAREIELVLQILSPKLDPTTADDDLEDSLLNLLNALDGLSDITVGDAERGMGNSNANLGFEIPLTITVTVHRKA